MPGSLEGLHDGIQINYSLKADQDDTCLHLQYSGGWGRKIDVLI